MSSERFGRWQLERVSGSSGLNGGCDCLLTEAASLFDSFRLIFFLRLRMAQAMPLVAAKQVYQTKEVTLVALGCGRGWSHAAWRCVPYLSGNAVGDHKIDTGAIVRQHNFAVAK
jgi:hypothetical protein